ncbi:unnamed protein product [Schistosoma guineensis]|nr:unnamed protein product [Schistosoma guineensis]
MIAQRDKWTLRIKAICFILIDLFIIWLINISPSLLYHGIYNESYTFLSENMELIDGNIFASNSSEFNLTMRLHKMYSTINETSIQNHSLRFDVEENRLKRLYDSLSKNNSVNFTISYRFDSTIYSPYGYYEPYLKYHGPKTRYPLPSRNFAAGKSKKVAWFVSNCAAKSPRLQYAEELSKYISVDIYGKCGTKVCSRNLINDPSLLDCFKLIRQNYKFYLSFENSLCSWYITEKLYKNALKNDLLPIVMGASIEEYERVAPPYSFIHVDQFESPAKLADYLKYLDKNDTAYNEYFAWHGHGIIHDWDSQPQCAMCLLAHTCHSFGPYWVPRVARWWNDGCNGRKLRWNL